MSDSSSNSDTSETPDFFANNPDFDDVIPIEQDDGPNPIVQIAYSAAFKDAFDYFRAIYASKEYSNRAYYLTEKCINLNSSNYTVWEFRRIIVEKMDLSCKTELAFTEKIMGNNPKNYQIWHHRACILELMQKSNNLTEKEISKELQLTEKVFSTDAKNYHAWQHRVALLNNYKTFFNYENEISLIYKMICVDYRNNSVWNYLYTLHNNDIPEFQTDQYSGYGFDKFNYNWLYSTIFIKNNNPIENLNDLEDPLSQIESSKNSMISEVDYTNEASWSFLSAIFKRKETKNEWKLKVSKKVLQLTKELDPIPYPVVTFIIDHYKFMEYEIEKLKELVKKLEETDPVRVNYWKFVYTTL